MLLTEYDRTYSRYAAEAGLPYQRYVREEDYVSAIKTALQWIALRLWIDGECWGALEIATGVGKTRIGIMAAGEPIRQSGYLENALISVSTEQLRDGGWPSQIAFWGYGDCMNNVVVECHQTSRTRVGDHFNTLVVDEAHRIFTPENIKLLENNTFDRILLLSATLTDKDKKAMMHAHGLNTIFEYTIDQAEDDGIVAANLRFTYYVELDGREQALYDTLTAKMDAIAEMEVSVYTGTDSEGNDRYEEMKPFGGRQFAFTNASKVIKDKVALLGLTDIQSRNSAHNYIAYVQRRKDVVYYAKAKYKLLKELQRQLFKNDKTIVFHEKTKFVDEMAAEFGEIATRYHSKIKPQKFKRELLDDFITGNKTILVAASALNEGLDVPSVKWGIVAAGTTSQLAKTQREGRIFRWDGNLAIFINLCCRGTIEEEWIRQSYRRRRTQPIPVTSIEQIKEQLRRKQQIT